jgi:hypothetical protein
MALRQRSRAAMTVFRDWRELPYREIWIVDTEFYPERGKANGGRDGDPITPLCLVAYELRSGRAIKLWQDELGPFPPYRLDPDALFIGYMNSAEFGFHIANGWGEPACALDAYIEFRHYTNDGSIKSGDRDKGFYSLAGALRYFCEDELDVAHKKDMRERIIQGPPFSAQEREDILEYCESDVRALARLIPHLVPTVRSLPHAVLRAKYQWPTAQSEHRGVPVDLPRLTQIRENWGDMRTDLVIEMDRPFGCYEIEDGQPHWRRELFKALVQRNRMSWPVYEDGQLVETDQTFREMEGKYPFIGPLRELRYSLSKLRLNDLQVGNDARARTMLGAYGTKTGRNAPSNSKFVFGPAKWIPVPDRAAAWPSAHSSRRLPAGSAYCRGGVGRRGAAAGLRERRRVFGHCQAARLHFREHVTGRAQGRAGVVQDRCLGHPVWAWRTFAGDTRRHLTL